MAESLLVNPEDPQPRLSFFDELPADVIASITIDEDRGHFTAERFFAQHPRLYKACVAMLSEDVPVEAIRRYLGVSDNTVRAVREREEPTIADFRAKIGKRRRRLMRQCMDRLEATVDAADFKDVGIVLAILDDKERLDSGSPTAIVGSVAPKPAEDEFAKFLHEQGFLDVEATVTPQTGFAGGAPEQKGAAPDPPPPADQQPQPPVADT
jgi:hypothetical protein